MALSNNGKNNCFTFTTFLMKMHTFTGQQRQLIATQTMIGNDNYPVTNVQSPPFKRDHLQDRAFLFCGSVVDVSYSQ